MKIVYTRHLKIRLKQRKIPVNYPRKVIQFSDQDYFDTFALRNISIKRIQFEGKLRNIVVAYDIIGLKIEIVTIHIISTKEIQNKVNSGRWRKYEKKEKD